MAGKKTATASTTTKPTAGRTGRAVRLNLAPADWDRAKAAADRRGLPLSGYVKMVVLASLEEEAAKRAKALGAKDDPAEGR